MKVLTVSILTVLLLGFMQSPAPAQLTGTVRDSEGAAISKAHAIIHWDPSGSNYLPDNFGIKQDISVETGSDGRFEVELPPGFYDVFVTATSFTPQCEKIRIKAMAPKSLEMRLKVSPVTSKELD
jgi:hypothetical protein